MNPEFEQRLQSARREDLILLLQELSVRHPVLLAEIMNILERLSNEMPSLAEEGEEEEGEEEVTEEWDFNRDEQVAPYTFPIQSPLFPLDGEAHQQRIEEFARRLRQEESPEALFDVLRDLVEGAISYSGQKDEYAGLDLFAMLIDERLLERSSATTPLFDEMIDAGMYSLEALLTEASSNTLFDVDTAALSPLLIPQVRHRWLERLFALWLKRIDAHKIEENLPELLLDVAWSEDILLLRSLVQSELQKQPPIAHENIVDFGRQYRTRALEKFLKELPHA